MLALFRKHVQGALPAALTLTLVAAAVMASSRDFQITSSPTRDGAVALVAVLWGVFGLLLGFATFTLEESHGTRTYWLHRGVHARSAFAAKTLAELSTLAAAFVVVIAFDAAWTSIARSQLGAAAPMYERYSELALAATAGVLGHALGSLGAHLRRPIAVRLLSTWFAGCGFVYLTAQWQLHVGDRWLRNEVAWLVWTLGCAALLYAIAERAFRSGPEEHHVPPQPIRFALNLVALAVGGVVCALCVALAQKYALVGALSDAPWVRQVEGAVRAADASESRSVPDTRVLFDPRERPDAWPAATEADDLRFAHKLQPFEFGDGWKSIGNMTSDARFDGVDPADERPRYTAWIGSRSGRVLLERLPSEASARGGEANTRRPRFLVERPDGKRFSRRLLVLPPSGERDVRAIYDAGDATLWSWAFDGEGPRLVRIELPNGDTPLGTDAAIDPKLVALRSPYTRWGASTTVVRGGSDRYRWSGEHFEPTPLLEGRVWRSSHDVPAQIDLELVDTDALEPHVLVRDATTRETLYEHHYEASGLLGLAAQVASVLRSPLGGIASSLDPSVRRPTDVALTKDPLLANGRRPWLLTLNIALSLALAVWFARRRVLGLRWGWFAVLALLGPSVLAIAFVIEPRTRDAVRVGCARRPRITAARSTRLAAQPST